MSVLQSPAAAVPTTVLPPTGSVLIPDEDLDEGVLLNSATLNPSPLAGHLGLHQSSQFNSPFSKAQSGKAATMKLDEGLKQESSLHPLKLDYEKPFKTEYNFAYVHEEDQDPYYDQHTQLEANLKPSEIRIFSS